MKVRNALVALVCAFGLALSGAAMAKAKGAKGVCKNDGKDVTKAEKVKDEADCKTKGGVWEAAAKKEAPAAAKAPAKAEPAKTEPAKTEPAPEAKPAEGAPAEQPK